jgi:hypothetical protein
MLASCILFLGQFVAAQTKRDADQLMYEAGIVSGLRQNAYMICPHDRAKTITEP